MALTFLHTENSYSNEIRLLDSLHVKVPHFKSKSTEFSDSSKTTKAQLQIISKSFDFQTQSEKILEANEIENLKIFTECQLSTFMSENILLPWSMIKSIRCDFISYFVNRKTENDSDAPIILTIKSTEYLIPAKSVFYLTNISKLNFFPELTDFDIIYADPPWKNKSVKRGKKYGTSEMNIVEIN